MIVFSLVQPSCKPACSKEFWHSCRKGGWRTFSCLWLKLHRCFFSSNIILSSIWFQALTSNPAVPTRPSGPSVHVALWWARWGKMNHIKMNPARPSPKEEHLRRMSTGYGSGRRKQETPFLQHELGIYTLKNIGSRRDWRKMRQKQQGKVVAIVSDFCFSLLLSIILLI